MATKTFCDRCSIEIKDDTKRYVLTYEMSPYVAPLTFNEKLAAEKKGEQPTRDVKVRVGQRDICDQCMIAIATELFLSEAVKIVELK